MSSGQDAFCRILKLSSPAPSPTAVRTQPAPPRENVMSPTPSRSMSLSSAIPSTLSASMPQADRKGGVEPKRAGRHHTDINVGNPHYDRRADVSSSIIRRELLETPELFERRRAFIADRLEKTGQSNLTHFRASDIHDGKDAPFRVSPGEEFDPAAEQWEYDQVDYHPRYKTDIHVGPWSERRLARRVELEPPFSRITTDVHRFGRSPGAPRPRPREPYLVDDSRNYSRKRTDIHTSPDPMEARMAVLQTKTYNRKSSSDIHPTPEARKPPVINAGWLYGRKDTDLHMGEGEGNLSLLPAFSSKRAFPLPSTDIHMEPRGSAWQPEPTRRVLIDEPGDRVPSRGGNLRSRDGSRNESVSESRAYGRKFTDLHREREW